MTSKITSVGAQERAGLVPAGPGADRDIHCGITASVLVEKSGGDQRPLSFAKLSFEAGGMDAPEMRMCWNSQDERQKRAAAWCRDAFGERDMAPSIRALRVIEEAAELAQAEGLSAWAVIEQIRSVYSRPVGDKAREVGGLRMTLSIYAETIAVSADGAELVELMRVESLPLGHFRARQAAKDAASRPLNDLLSDPSVDPAPLQAASEGRLLRASIEDRLLWASDGGDCPYGHTPQRIMKDAVAEIRALRAAVGKQGWFGRLLKRFGKGVA